MQLKSLEMLGFKSFRNRTKITFTDGITALVGPNGCGKTNIVDAIRWVLGELSPSLLRCDRMGDIIFSGSSDRKELGVAEVTLTVSNDAGEIPVDYSEVAITRRLYRSNESEYYLNRNLCRLKDIHSLLLNTGVSHKSYSVFENAMIDRILSKDHSYKRFFLEEASKIAKYRERKNEALRKLGATENDVRNLKEVIAEAERFTSSLKRQANKARRHSELKQELSFLRASSLKAKYATLKERLAVDSKRFERSKAEKSKLSLVIEGDEQEMGEIRLKSDEVEHRIGQLDLELRKSDESIGELEKQIATYKERIRGERERVRREQNEFDAGIQVKEDLARSISSGGVKSEEVKTALATSQCRLTELRQRLEEMGQSDLPETRDRLRQEEADRARKIMELEAFLENGVERVKSIESEVKSVSREKETLLKSLHEGKQSISTFLKEEKRLKDQIAELEDERDSWRKGMVRIEGQLSRLSARFEGERLSSSPWIESNHSILRDYLSIESRCEKAIIGALGIRLMAPCVHKRKNLLKIVENLRREKVPRNVLLTAKVQRAPVPEIPQEPSVLGRAVDFVEAADEAKGVLEWLLCDYVVVTDLSVGLRCSKKFPDLSFASLEGDVLESDGTVWTGLFEEEQKDASDQLKKMRAGLNDKLRQTEPELKSLMGIHSNLQMKRMEREAERNRVLPDITRMEERMASLMSALGREKRGVNSLRRRLKEEKRKRSHVEDEIRRADLLLSSEGHDREALSSEENELRVKVSVLEERVRTIAREIERDTTALKEKEGSLKELEQNLMKSSASAEELEATLTEKFGGLELLIQKRNGVLESKNEVELERRRLQERVGYLTEHRKVAQSDTDRLSETLHRAEMELVELTRERDSLRERTVSEHGIDLEQFECEETPDLDRIEKVENSLRRLGTVNPLAMEEYEKERKRLDFLRSQLNDLMLAKRYLLDTIAFIDKRATSQFREAFAHVRRNFLTVFTKLFEGGVADLRLVDDGDVFDSSIELVANPKGKRLKSLDALSGGERALVAIALLFALYLYRPSPFCVLDEIDAALDDANVARFLSFLKELSTDTQFLVVTHNKKTMEAANSLYGITMQEPGISKIVSVRLGE
jgi:chromosome segregation protein